MSALGAASSGPSAYLRSKAEGESAIRETSEAPCTIFRPSVIFGEHDHFLNRFATFVRFFPAIPLPGAGARFQPVWVEDVARCFVAALGDPRTFGQAYELCGPRVYTNQELVRFVADTLGRKTGIVALPHAVASFQALFLQHAPGPFRISPDNLKSMSVDNVCASDFPPVFGFQPMPLEAVAPDYLTGRNTRARYDRYRHYAGR
jgi:NADH dehydrogenase